MADEYFIIKGTINARDEEGNVIDVLPRTALPHVVGYEKILVDARCDDHTLTFTNAKGEEIVVEISNEVITPQEINDLMTSIFGYSVQTRETELINYYSENVISGDIPLKNVPRRLKPYVIEIVNAAIVEYAGKVISEKITVDDVPSGIRQDVIDYIREHGG